jgi:uncharacterized protein YcfL
MKKLFAILMIGVVFTACNSKEEKTTTTDSTSTESPLMDAVNTRDSASKIIQDSIHPIMDTIIKK